MQDEAAERHVICFEIAPRSRNLAKRSCIASARLYHRAYPWHACAVTRVCVLLVCLLSASCDVSTIELLADLADGGSPPDASGGLPPSRDGSPGVVTPECTDSGTQCMPLCVGDTGQCVQCVKDADCELNEVCDMNTGSCIAVEPL